MPFQRLTSLLLILASSLLWNCQDQPTAIAPQLIPTPQTIKVRGGYISLQNGVNFKVQSPELAPLEAVAQQDFERLTGISKPGPATINLQIDHALAQEAYHLKIDESITISGGSYGAVSMGLITLWQVMNDQQQVAQMKIEDQPDHPYRSIMLDAARGWHLPETIKEIIELCRWYKINNLHLHLTDDNAFSFPSEAFPQLTSKNHHYTKAELLELNQFAHERGVTLIPEIDVPGHSSEIVRNMPELFGLQNVANNPYTITMGREATYDALQTLFHEIAEAFPYSPYIHIGADETFTGGMEDDPETVAYLAANDLPNLEELYRHFITRMNTQVKKAGKQMLVWSGFAEKGDIEIPKDVIVMVWESPTFAPQKLIDAGYTVINASWKPLYVVNNRKWTPEYIYKQWTPNRWESWAVENDTFTGTEVIPNQQVLGATMCAWEQSQVNQLPRLRHRIASMSDKVWSGGKTAWHTFSKTQQAIDAKLSRFLRPFEVTLDGLTYPDLGEGNFYEHRWFKKQLKVSAKAYRADYELQYATQARPAKADWIAVDDAIILDKNAHLHIRAINNKKQPIGRIYHQRFFLKPLSMSVMGRWKDLPIGAWEKQRFEDTLTIHLNTELSGYDIRYSVEGGRVSTDSPKYNGPIKVTKTTHFSALLFDSTGTAFGSSVNGTFFKIKNEPSLTTGKKVWASNEAIAPGLSERAVNGRVTLWEMWGDHTDEENWVKVDLGQVEEVAKLKVYTFWDNWRYYQYTIEGSLDGENWSLLVDNSKNEEISTPDGITHEIETVKAQFLKINLLYNSANPGLHLVEFGAFGPEQ